MGVCHVCSAVYTDPVGFRDTCPSCQSYLHCCLNCRLYCPSASNHCLSPTAEFVGDIQKANFCEEFEFTDRKSPAAAPEKEGRRKFDQLFGD